MTVSDTPLFTVFTATYNRAHTLHRVFDSLTAQSLQDFEWLIVDDGSTDQTEQTVAAWKKLAHFDIRYIRQAHGGKHIAHNRALREARGKFFAILDSDDALPPSALERMLWHWNSIPEAERSHYWAVLGLACDENGQLVGDRFPPGQIDFDFRELRYVYRVQGEKFLMAFTEVLRRYPFPEISGTQFVPEGAIWFEIAKTFKLRAVNEICRIYYCRDTEANMALSSRSNLTTSARGRLYYYVWILNNDIEYLFRSPEPFLKAALMLPTVSFYSQRTLRQTFGALHNLQAKCLALAVFPLAALLCLRYRLTNPPAKNA